MWSKTLQLGHAGEGVEIWRCSNPEGILITSLQLGHAGEGVEMGR